VLDLAEFVQRRPADALGWTPVGIEAEGPFEVLQAGEQGVVRTVADSGSFST